MKTYYLDIETGGISSWTDGIASISLMNSEAKEPTNFFIKPQKKFYSHEALRVNGLDLTTLENVGKPLREVLDQIILNDFNEKAVRIIGHNIEFDLKFMLQACKEAGVKLPIVHYICTMELAKRHLKKERKIKSVALSEVHRYFFPEREVWREIATHTSHGDVIMCKEIFKPLWKLENAN